LQRRGVQLAARPSDYRCAFIPEWSGGGAILAAVIDRALLTAAVVLAGVATSASAAPVAKPVVITPQEHARLTLKLLRNPYPIFNDAAPKISSGATLTQTGTSVLESAAKSPRFTRDEKAELRSALRILQMEGQHPVLADLLFRADPVLFPSGTENRPLAARIKLLAAGFNVLGRRSGANPRYASEAYGTASEIVQAGAQSLYSMNDPSAARFYSAVAKKGALAAAFGSEVDSVLGTRSSN
jgi:hypothetical protein